jgi:hypothetical protein
MLPVDNQKISAYAEIFHHYWPALTPLPAPYPPLVVPAGRTWIVCAVRLPSELDVPPTIMVVPTFSVLAKTVVGSETDVEVE